MKNNEKQLNLVLLPWLKNKLRTIKLCYLLAIFISLIIISCDDNSNDYNKNDVDYEKVGIEHNQGLDYVLDKLEVGAIANQSRLKSNNPDELLLLVKEHCASFLTEKSSVAKENLNESLVQLNKYYEENIIQSKLKSDTSEDETNANLSEVQKKYISEILNIVNDTTLDLEICIDRIKRIENLVKKECSEQDCQIILSTASITRNSLEYWCHNHNKWLTKLCSTVVDTIYNENSRLKDDVVDVMPPGWYVFPTDNTKCLYVMADPYMILILDGPDGTYFNPSTSCFESGYGPSFDWSELAIEDAKGALAGALLGAAGGVTILPSALASALAGSAGSALAQYFRLF